MSPNCSNDPVAWDQDSKSVCSEVIRSCGLFVSQLINATSSRNHFGCYEWKLLRQHRVSANFTLMVGLSLCCVAIPKGTHDQPPKSAQTLIFSGSLAVCQKRLQCCPRGCKVSERGRFVTSCLCYTAEISTVCREIPQEKAYCRLYIHFSVNRNSQILWIYVQGTPT